MTEWKLVQGSQETKPAEFDTSSSAVYVYQRRNIKTVTNNEGSQLWEYEERKLTKEEYPAVLAEQNSRLSEEITNLQLAICELYELNAQD